MSHYHVYGIGAALVDTEIEVSDSDLHNLSIDKGVMTLVDESRQQQLIEHLSNHLVASRRASGGSAANTIIAASYFGASAFYSCKVANDENGDFYLGDLQAAGVDYHRELQREDGVTGKCLVMITPDAERTMNTYLGAAVHLSPEEIDEEAVAASKVTYLEGYLWDAPPAKEAYLKAAKIAHANGREVALSLSDPFCVDRHRASFLDLVAGHVDLLFANEDELLSLYEVGSFDEALQRVRGHCKVAALTRSEKGAVILSGEEIHVIDAAPVEKVVDTTGAGDLFAAGFLYGYSKGLGLDLCGRLGALAAAEIISHYGARPEADLAELAKAVL